MKKSLFPSLLKGLTMAAIISLAMACQNPMTGPNLDNSPSQSRAIVSGLTQVEAETFSDKAGVQLENCSEGGQDVGWIDSGDWMVYPITITTAGSYKISYRVASPNGGKSLSADINAGATKLGSVEITNTGAWQTWKTVSHIVTLPAGTFNFGVNGGTGGFNLNWIQFEPVTAGIKIEAENYSVMNGIIKEPCSDTDGGQDIGAIDAGDWMVYPVTIPSAGKYTIQYRVSSIYTGKTLSADLNAGATQLGSVIIPNTGAWQTWHTVTQDVTLPAGAVNLGINGGSGGFNLNWLIITPGGTGGDPVTPTTLIPLNAGKQMTFQFKNNTNGSFSDSQIYVLMIARDNAGKFCWLDKNGNMIRCVSGENASNYSIKMSDFAGFQFPTFLDSGRLYISLSKPLSVAINTDGAGNVGVAFPNIENPADANINTYFEWVEFAVINNEIWCNTTQVDQFGFPMVMELFTGSSTSYKSFDKVGVSETRAAIWSAYASSMPAEFKALASTYRILAPLHGNFRAGQANGAYYDGYINSIWEKYRTTNLVITVPDGTYTGRTQADNRIRFSRSGDSNFYYVAKPTGEGVWGGLGAFNAGSPESGSDGVRISREKVLESQICAAFHRHVMDNPATWATSSQYYLTGPADYFSKFWHQHSINSKAYGFCYDDVNDQSSTVHSINPRGIILSIGF